MASLSQLIVKISADASGFEKTINGLQKSAASMAEKFEQAGSVLTRAVSLPLGLLGGAALKSAADFEGLRRGLEAVTGSAAKAEAQFQSLKKVAELPGLGFREAVQGSINLQAAGFSANTAERALKAFGNALATVGKGRAELDGVILALSQIQSKGKVSAEEINQLAERLPQIRQALKAAFGTSNTEEIQKLGISSEQAIERIIKEFEKLPAVTGGLRNSFENLRDRAEQSLAALGGAIAPFATKAIDAIDPLIGKLGELGKGFAALPDPVQKVGIGIAGLAIAAGPIASVVAKFKELQVIVLKIAAATGSLGVGGFAAILGGGALLAAKNNLDALSDSYDSAQERAKTFQDRLKDPDFVKKLKEQASEIGDFGIRLAQSGAKAGVSAEQLKLAFAGLNVKPVAQLKEELAAAEKNFQTINDAAKQGLATQQDLANAAAAVKAAHDALNVSVEQTRLVFKAISFADKSKDNELFAASIAKIGQESDRLKKEVANLQEQIDNGPKFDELVGPNIELGVTAFARLIPHAKEFNTDLLTAGERTAKFVDGLAKIEAQSALTADALQNIKIPQILKDIQEDIKKTTSKFKAPELSAFAQEVKRIGNMMSNTLADTIVRAESLGKAFAKIGQEIAATILTYAINQGIKLLIGSLDGLINKLGSVGKAIQDAFGGVAKTPGIIPQPSNSGAPVSQIASGGLASTVTAVSSVATAVFSALQFLQGRRMEQDIGRIEVTSRGQLNQLVSLQETLNTYLPNLLNTQYLLSIDEGIKRIYQGLSQVDFSGIRGEGAITIGTINVSGGATVQDGERVAEALKRTLRLKSRAFA